MSFSPNTNIDRAASIAWFEAKAGQIVRWSELQQPYLFYASRPKGIWVPKGWDYPLSIKQTLESKYKDSEVFDLPEGGWIYWYHKEEGAESQNRALVRAMDAHVPVGVLIQVVPKPNSQYWVVGLGEITGFDGEYFEVRNWEGASTSGRPALVAEVNSDAHHEEPFNPESIDKQIEIRMQPRVIRHGQGIFRAKLMTAYGSQCAVTGTPVKQTLDAAHIHPYAGRSTNAISNGLLLRADIHRLFDERLLVIDTATMTEVISPQLRGTEYESLHGRPLLLPKKPGFHPSVIALDKHREQAGF